MFKATKKRDKRVRPNLVPIMDAVFIFIFFLLMSAQFIDIYEINSDAPAVVTIDKKIDKKDPLNLVLEINPEGILIKTGLVEKDLLEVKKNDSGKYDLTRLNKALTDLKLKNIDEEAVILRPTSTVAYADIVKIMDSIRETENNQILTARNKKGELIKTVSLFNKIIFETII
ncbi:MAG: hypothetical protein A2381_13845 [Bdellovibrionales bacterium RIFOXYB1_FULL_37_110]|nr:MAG: hypothetical protein A2417_05480 [Bdellovibrionales bacterium RIFOXYC1_FULL_37_79]OFZ56943.1 MAG: hypothetical protein A2381_13845 [Bdellovibrionales bacterium RIFOXYB1_FULL_37_110]OFZ62030.1 MAG: hypothetical protein A2577_19315 [Bdellovibrionales bacterium RIFOXYD1_FULL_36_51]